MNDDFETHPIGTGKRLAERALPTCPREDCKATIDHHHGIDSGLAYACARTVSGHCKYHHDGCGSAYSRCYAARTAPAEDERISAWEAIAAHPFFAPCYATAAPLLLSMLDRLDGLAAQPTPQPPAVVRLPDGWERGHDAKYWVETGLTPYGLTLDEERAPGVLNWLGVNYYRCEPAPQPTDPADVRVGDRVRVEYTATVDLAPMLNGEGWAGCDFADRRFYLLDRPNPDAALHAAIEAAWDAADTFEASAFVAALRSAGYVIEPAAGEADDA